MKKFLTLANLKKQNFNWTEQYLLHAILLTIIYYCISKMWLWLRVRESSFYKPIFIFDFFEGYTLFSLVFISILIVMIVLNFSNYNFSNYFKNQLAWSNMAYGNVLRGLMLLATAIMAWSFSAYDMNLYFLQWHPLERILLLITFVAIFFSPIAIFPFTLLLMVILQQFNYPTIFYYSWTDKLLIIHFIFLCTAFVLGKFWLRLSTQSFMYVTLCMVGTYYFTPGLAKLSQDGLFTWFITNRLDNLWMSSWMSGWMSFLNSNDALSIASIIRYFNSFSKIMTLIIELGAIVLLFHKRLSMLLIASAVLLHIGIMISSGIFFWKWLLLDVGLLSVLILFRSDDLLNKIFKPKFAILSVGLIYFGGTIFGAPLLGWLDTGMIKNYDFIAVAEDGTRTNVSRLFFDPYDIIFAQNRFDFLYDGYTIVGAYGAVRNYDTFNAIQNVAPDYESLQEISLEFGSNKFDPILTSRFESFIYTWFLNNNNVQNTSLLPNWLKPPHHITTMVNNNVYDGARVSQIIVVYSESLYQNETIYDIYQEEVLIIEIP